MNGGVLLSSARIRQDGRHAGAPAMELVRAKREARCVSRGHKLVSRSLEGNKYPPEKQEENVSTQSSNSLKDWKAAGCPDGRTSSTTQTLSCG